MNYHSKLLRISLIWLLFFIIQNPSSSADTTDFISIDCGGVGKTLYTETSTRIQWQPDEEIMKMGLSATIKDPTLLGVGMTSQPLTTLRYFPETEMNKFCYELGPVTEGRVYLVRASFLHGNYNGRNELEVYFDLFLEADFWDSVEVYNTSSKIQKEAYLITQRRNVSVCIARTDISYTPFISSLELRPIDGQLYATDEMKKSKRLMFTARRYNMGALTNDDIRYPDDKYDRIWNARSSAAKITTATPVTSTSNDAPPSLVMQTAWGISTTFRQLEFTFAGLEIGTYFLAMYFAEIEPAVGLGYRTFNITVNEFNWFGPVDIVSKMGSFKTYMVYSDELLISKSTLVVLVNSTDGSPLGPLWNAVELIQLSDRPANATTLTDDVEALSDVKMGLGLTNWTGDPCLPVTHPYPWVNCSIASPPRVTSLMLHGKDLQGSLPQSINSLVSLTEINFERNQLSGNIPSWPSLLKLKKLNLRNNNLSGPIPEFLGELPNLVELSLQNNNLSGVIPEKILDRVSRSGLILNVAGNPNLCNSNSCPPASSSQLPAPSSLSNPDQPSQYGWKKILIIVSVSTGAAIAITLIIILVCCLARRTQQEPEPFPAVGPPKKGAVSIELEERQGKKLSYEEIKIATNEFKNRIGVGGFGEVFSGTWKGDPVAVKVLSESSDQGRREFISEVQILSKVHHRNLVSLVGYCEMPKLVLVYEYMGGGSLYDLLNESSSDCLPWGVRLNIALDAAQALEYLHSSCEPSIIHGDVKSSNILLEENMQAKFGDFGLSRLHKDKVNDIRTTCVRGSGGYLDPVYYSTGTLNEKSDVYSFGVVLLEIITGRLPINQDSITKQHERNLADWARIKYEQGVGIETIIDKRLRNVDQNTIPTICMVMNIAIACVNPEREDRPKMSKVVENLKKALLIGEKTTEYVSNDTTTYMRSESLYQVRAR